MIRKILSPMVTMEVIQVRNVASIARLSRPRNKARFMKPITQRPTNHKRIAPISFRLMSASRGRSRVSIWLIGRVAGPAGNIWDKDCMALQKRGFVGRVKAWLTRQGLGLGLAIWEGTLFYMST